MKKDLIVCEEPDLLPEYIHYEDEGCDLSETCLDCPLPDCVYDTPHGKQLLLKRRRDEGTHSLLPSREREKMALALELVDLSLLEALQAKDFAGEWRVGGGAGLKARRPAALPLHSAGVVRQAPCAAHVGVPVREAAALALAAGLLPGLNDEDLGDSHKT